MASAKLASERRAMTGPNYPTEDAIREDFSFGSNGFLVNGISRERGQSLRRLLFPELMTSKKAIESTRMKGNIYTPSWITPSWTKAQLKHYGICHDPDVEPFRAKALLLMSVANGQQLPKWVQEFEVCATPTEEVKCDRLLFLHKYFRDKDGNPDRSKTPALMLLPGCTLEDSGLLKGQAACVPGLHVADGGLPGQDAIIVIGWDRARVNRKAREIDLQQTQGGGIIRSSENWDKVMMKHYNHQENSQTVGLFAGSFGDYGISGVFALRSEKIQLDWPSLSRQMRMRVIMSGQLAIFDLGIVSGLMILGKTQEDVSKIIEAGTWDFDPSEYFETSDEEETDEEASGSISDRSDDNTKDEPDDTASHHPAKRRKGQASEFRRMYFQWRGWNTMSGAIQHDPQNRNTGYLDFANNLATAFEGKIYMELTQGETRFQGLEIPGMSGPLTLNWDKLSHLESDRAKVREHLW